MRAVAKSLAALSGAFVLLVAGCASLGGRAVANAPITTPEIAAAGRLLPVPDVRQGTNYSCGAVALQAVLSYYGGDWVEGDLVPLVRSDPQLGTAPDNMAQAARDLGFRAEIRTGLTLEDLERAVGEGIPVIVAVQAWRESAERPWAEEWEEGHYLVVIGLDAAQIYFEDPSLLGSRGFMRRGEFLERWHDYVGPPPLDETDRKVERLGLFITGATPHPQPLVTHVD